VRLSNVKARASEEMGVCLMRGGPRGEKEDLSVSNGGDFGSGVSQVNFRQRRVQNRPFPSRPSLEGHVGWHWGRGNKDLEAGESNEHLKYMREEK